MPISGTIQNDLLKEYIARGTYVYPPRPSMRIITDIFAYCRERIPRWNTISISGYHIREAGSTAVQEIAFTIADGIAYVEAAIAAGLDVDEFAPSPVVLLERPQQLLRGGRQVPRRPAHLVPAHDRALRGRARRRRSSCASTPRPVAARSPPSSPRTTSCGSPLQALAAVMGGTQSLHTNGFDEALGLPTEQAAKVALRTQQIIGYESGVVDTADPLAGSYFVEALTDEVERLAWEYLATIDEMGGAVAAIEAGYQQSEIEQAAYEYTKSIDDGERVIVGVNRYTEAVEAEPVVFPIDPGGPAAPDRAPAGSSRRRP